MRINFKKCTWDPGWDVESRVGVKVLWHGLNTNLQPDKNLIKTNTIGENLLVKTCL